MMISQFLGISGSRIKWFERSDWDGFFALGLDSLIQLILIDTLCRYVVGFPSELIYGRILPGAAVSFLIGNLFYGWQAMRLSAATGRTDVCALPYGINTIALFAYVFLVLAPAKQIALAAGAADPNGVAWRVGLLACLGAGLIEFFGAFFADKIRQATPRAALLATLSGICLGFISLNFFFRTFAHPLVGMGTLGLIMLLYFGGVKFKWGLPGGLVAFVLGTIIAWCTGLAPVGACPTEGLTLRLPVPVVMEILQAFHDGYFWVFASVIIPMGLVSVVISLQNIESAEAAGDSYPTRPSLMVNGLGTIGAAFFGSCFPTTIYIGHPGWKATGARAGYSTLTALMMTAICLSGSLLYIVWAIPVDAGMAILLWIGVFVTAQAFTAVPAAHAPAVVLGILPGVAAWGTQLIKNALRVAGYGSAGGPEFSEKLFVLFQSSDIWVHGAFALEQGYIYTSMIFAATTVCLVEKKFNQAAVWCLVATALCLTGFMHSYKFVPGDSVGLLRPGLSWASGYFTMAVTFFLAKYVTEDGSAH